MAPVAAHVSAALLVGLLAPAAAIQTAADEKTMLTGFDLTEFTAGLLHGVSGSSAKGLERIKECSKLAVDLKGVTGALSKMQSTDTMFAGIKDLLHEVQVTGPEFKGCKRGLLVGAKSVRAMWNGGSKTAPEGFIETAKEWLKPVMHFTELKDLASTAAASLKAAEYKEAGESMGKILKVAGIMDLEPAKETPGETAAGGAPPTASKGTRSKGLLGFLSPSKPAAAPAKAPTPEDIKGFFEYWKKKR